MAAKQRRRQQRRPPDRVLLPRGESALRSGEYLGPPAFAPDGSVWAGFVSLGRPRDSVVARLSAFGATEVNDE